MYRAAKRLSRRSVLRAAGAAVSLPLLDAMAPPLKATVEPATRMAYLYFPNGIPRGTWEPEKVGANGRLEKLNEWMRPLEPFKEDILLPTNVWTPQGHGHIKGPPTWLTGQDYDAIAINAGGISVDQFAAQRVGRDTLLPSLELMTKGEGFMSKSLPRNSLSWAAADRPLAREFEPRAIFDRMFRPPAGGASKRSVLDMVLADARSLEGRLGRADRERLEQYFEAIRALEKRIAFSERQTQELTRAGEPTETLMRPQAGIPSDHGEYVRQLLDLVVLAFQSNATRVVTFMLDHGQSNRYFNFIENVRGTWHALSHYKNASGQTEDDDGTTSWESVEEKRAMYAEVQRWHHTQVAYFLGRLKSVREPDGSTLLDSAMIAYGSSLGDGNEHDKHHLPTLLAGRGRGAFRTGRQMANAEPYNFANVHAAMLRGLGLDVEAFASSDSNGEELR